MICLHCGAQLPPNLLACPSCHALVHAAELKTLATAAEAATAAGNLSEALANWRKAVQLLPEGSAQHTAIKAKIVALSQQVSAGADQAATTPKPKWAEGGGVLGVIGLLFWKFKFLVLFLLTKAKLLLLGFTKMGTVFSMLVSLMVYCQYWGWKFAAGFIFSIYIHEMGHVFQLSRYGIAATAPMFIPGLGAMIRLKQYPATPHEDAVTGLAGPMWGLGASVLWLLIYLGTGAKFFAGLTVVNSGLNLFNLVPVWQLDGSHGIRPLTRVERFWLTGVVFGLWLLTGKGWLVIIAAVMGFRAFQKDVAEKKDLAIFGQFAFLIVALSLLTTIKVNIPGLTPSGSDETTQLHQKEPALEEFGGVQVRGWLWRG